MYSGRLRVSLDADITELKDNLRCAFVMLDTFEQMSMEIRPHQLLPNVKNPEYLINGQLADRKGIHSEKGITDAFKKCREQGCSVVVLDFDKNLAGLCIHANQIAKYLSWRPDFTLNLLHTCYVIHNSKVVELSCGMSRKEIEQKLEQL